MNKTTIQWTDETWNPLVGCRRVSEGCRNCYAERLISSRLSKHPVYRGLAVMKDSGPQFTGDHRIIADRLDEPLRKRKGVKVFVNDLGDLFYEGHTNEEIAAVFGVMAAAPRHTFQVLTKRAKRMAEWFEWASARFDGPWATCMFEASKNIPEEPPRRYAEESIGPLDGPWPLPNVWLGVSTEDQTAAVERIRQLLRCQARVRFLSVEPQIGPIDLVDAVGLAMLDLDMLEGSDVGIHWVIQGGESGPRARPFNVAWARSARDQCKAAGVAYFLKQLGRAPHSDPSLFGPLELRNVHDPHGGIEGEWPPDLRGCRAFPRTS